MSGLQIRKFHRTTALSLLLKDNPDSWIIHVICIRGIDVLLILIMIIDNPGPG